MNTNQYSAIHNPWIAEITQQNQRYLKKLAFGDEAMPYDPETQTYTTFDEIPSEQRPAFPTTLLCPDPGLTKRELIAVIAMAGCLAAGDAPNHAAGLAVEAADELLKSLAQSDE